MRKLFTLLLYSISIVVSATDYYISSAGNDASNGLSPSTSWKSVTKVNSEFKEFKPGDRILFNRGDTFAGTLNITQSGSNGNPITIGAYGSGANPVMNGFTTVTEWTNIGGGVYSKVVPCESSPIMVTFDGVNTGMGRFPDATWMTPDSYSGTKSLTDSDLSSAVSNWTGAEVVIKTNLFITNHLPITGHSGSILTYSAGTTYTPISGHGYFIQNDLRTVTAYKEWYYNAETSTFYMYFGSENPASHIVKVASSDNAINISGYSYITIDGLSFYGFNKNVFDLNAAPHITIKNCLIIFVGNNAVDGTELGTGTSSYFVFDNNTISDVNNNGIYLIRQFTQTTITNNKINNVGLIFGTGYPRNLMSHGGIRIGPHGGDNVNSVIEYNTLTKIGYVGIYFMGTNIIVRNNFIDTFCVTENDGGALYTYQEDSQVRSAKILNNIALNGIGNISGTSSPSYHRFAPGIYTDGYSNGITIDGNTIANCTYSAGYLTLNNTNGTFTDNTIFGNRYQIYTTNLSGISGMDIQRNKLICKASDSYTWYFYGAWTSSSATIDYNCYARPIKNADYINYWPAPADIQHLTLEQWKSVTGKDEHSYTSSTTITDVNKFRFEYNATKSDKEFVLDGNYIDVDGNKYAGSLTLLPFTSAVLMVDPNPSVSPASPVYSGSTIGNSTPSVLEMTYNLTFANIVPAISAFSVTVNSSTRTINSVAISGTKVLLTLSSPVSNGDVITVSYTKPSANPLQTAAGGQAVSLSAQTVTNNVALIPVPAYVSSSVENATSSKINIVYSLNLANKVPPVSAFAVTVNSAARTVNSVTVSGTTVILTITSAVAYGDVVKVAYSKPSSNPLQTAAGGQVASFTAQTVSNKVQIINAAPVVMVNYQSTTYSGFVNELNAAGSYDANNDKLTYSWVIPANISVSSTTSSTIQYLCPVVDAARTVQFVVNVSDGKTTRSKTIPVEIVPYEPGLDVAEVVKVEASGYLAPNYPSNIIDANIGTMWAVNGDNQWLLLELKGPFNVQHVKLAFQPGYKRESYFDILGSEDMVKWDLILPKSNSCAFSGNLQVFDFPQSKAEKEFKYIKLIGHGNSLDTWNYISEFKIFGYKHKNPASYEQLSIKIFPNPAHEFVNIRIDDATLKPDFIRIVNLAGNIVFQDKLDPDIKDMHVPIDLRQGLYIIQMGSVDLTLFSQKLVVSSN
jgi:uncharacterized repeat protein (TIGR02059 family)